MTTSSALRLSNDRIPMPEKSLVIVLHGIGASGAQLMPLASSWRSLLPAARFAAPDAPMHHRYGHQWFSTEGNPLEPAKILAARKAFDAVIGDVVPREGFDGPYDGVALVGVSQGAITVHARILAYSFAAFFSWPQNVGKQFVPARP